MADNDVELARRDEGGEFSSVRLTLDGDGKITMAGHDISPRFVEIWGDDEYEYWLRVAPDALAKLAFELLREKFAGQLRAVSAFRDWCRAHDVPAEFTSWP